MCIRDRSKGEAEADASRKVAETELEANDASRGGVYLFFLAMFAAGFLAVLFATFAWVSPLTIAAVSYTHLDVYKRQVIYLTRGGLDAAPGFSLPSSIIRLIRSGIT